MVQRSKIGVKGTAVCRGRAQVPLAPSTEFGASKYLSHLKLISISVSATPARIVNRLIMKNIFSIRELFSLLLSIVTPGFVFGTIGLLFGNARESIWAFPLVTKFSFIVALLIGLPAILILNYLKAHSIAWYLVVGIVASLALGNYFILPNVLKADLSLGWSGYAAQYVVLLILSLIASSVYWFVARPDKVHAF